MTTIAELRSYLTTKDPRMLDRIVEALPDLLDMVEACADLTEQLYVECRSSHPDFDAALEKYGVLTEEHYKKRKEKAKSYFQNLPWRRL